MLSQTNLLILTLLASTAITSIVGQVDIPTLVPASPFNPTDDAQKLRNTMSGVGTDEQAIVDILCRRVASQRAEIASTYESSYGRTLVRDLNSELNGELLQFTVSLTYSMSEYMARELHDTMFLPGTDEASLSEILISRKSAEIKDISDDFYRIYGFYLVDMIRGDTAGSVESLMVAMAEGSRDDGNQIDPVLVQSDVSRLYNAGQGLVDDTNEEEFVAIFSERNYAHLVNMSEEYKLIHFYSLDYIIDMEFTGDIKNALITILEYARSKENYFAKRLRGSTLSPTSTDETALNRQIISRCETDLGNIKIEYEDEYGHSLTSDVSADTVGVYRSGLLILIG